VFAFIRIQIRIEFEAKTRKDFQNPILFYISNLLGLSFYLNLKPWLQKFQISGSQNDLNSA
jgi:hypothetical protein